MIYMLFTLLSMLFIATVLLQYGILCVHGRSNKYAITRAVYRTVIISMLIAIIIIGAM